MMRVPKPKCKNDENILVMVVAGGANQLSRVRTDFPGKDND